MPKPPSRPRIPRRPVHGVLLLDKPLGLSSNDALQKVKRLFRAEKAGHTGTLDPLATGLLPLCFGAATKFSQISLDADKRYTATLQLGITTTTADAEGEVMETRPVVMPDGSAITDLDIKAACEKFIGKISQLPPMYSALKRDGKPLYEYARAGIEIEREPREITIHSIEVLELPIPADPGAMRQMLFVGAASAAIPTPGTGPIAAEAAPTNAGHHRVGAPVGAASAAIDGEARRGIAAEAAPTNAGHHRVGAPVGAASAAIDSEARRGIAAEAAPTKTNTKTNADPTLITLDIRCTKGTYIRTLAEDIGKALGCGAHLAALRRTETGPLTLADALTLDQLQSMDEQQRDAILHPADKLLADWPLIRLDAENAGRFLSGVRRRVQLPDTPHARVYGPEEKAFLGSAHITAGELISDRLLSPAEVKGLLATEPIAAEAAPTGVRSPHS